MEVDRDQVVAIGFGEIDENMAIDEDGCATPRREECRIREMSAPPPTPRKKPFVGGGKKRGQPKNGYFHPPDLETFFAMAPRPACKACTCVN